jgi:hypothetical protein
VLAEWEVGEDRVVAAGMADFDAGDSGIEIPAKGCGHEVRLRGLGSEASRELVGGRDIQPAHSGN